jgi:hypothetical protein
MPRRWMPPDLWSMYHRGRWFAVPRWWSEGYSNRRSLLVFGPDAIDGGNPWENVQNPLVFGTEPCDESRRRKLLCGLFFLNDRVEISHVTRLPGIYGVQRGPAVRIPFAPPSSLPSTAFSGEPREIRHVCAVSRSHKGTGARSHGN